MGSRFAARLLDKGHDVSVWKRTPTKMQPLVERGATAHHSPADATRSAEAVITMLADPGALREVTEGPSGVVEGMSPEVTLIEMSTVDPDAISRLASAVKSKGALIDAPVLGSTNEAELGELLVFVGGRTSLFERWSPLLADLGTPLHAGSLGSGAAAKLTANLTLVGTLGVLGEALALAHGLGLERDIAFEVLSHTPAAAQAERRRAATEKGYFPKRFDLTLARKDAALIAEAGASAPRGLKGISAVHEWFVEADEAGWGNLDYSAILAWITGAPKPQ
jgi:3-hydroxyisobutyrate dehydrogenase-like beta-hydroxyacid dehydrogenase